VSAQEKVALQSRTPWAFIGVAWLVLAAAALALYI
jgi:hypothetical protein